MKKKTTEWNTHNKSYSPIHSMSRFCMQLAVGNIYYTEIQFLYLICTSLFKMSIWIDIIDERRKKATIFATR